MKRGEYLRRKLRQRFAFVLVGLALYFSLGLTYLDLPLFAGTLPGTDIPAPLALYLGIIAALLLLELLFLWRARRLRQRLDPEEAP